MTGLDLGELQGPLLFFGGPYSNLQATQALISYARQQAIPASHVICTGDIVAYCAQPNETLNVLRDWGVSAVMGNCEESLGCGARNCGCGFEEGSACDALAQSWYRFAQRKVSDDHRRWMRSLPRIITFGFMRKRFAVIHGGVTKINQFIFPSSNAAVKRREIQAAKVDGVIAGHCGLPFTQQFGGKMWHNPGVIGMPANDGTPRGWVSVWNTVEGKIKIEHRALVYDVEAAYAAMIREGLGNGYAEALISGLWPSMDVLPDEEKAQRANALREAVYWL